MTETLPSDSELSGMTVNERLVACSLIDDFDEAVRNRDREHMISILIQTTISPEQAQIITDAVLTNPKTYGYYDPMNDYGLGQATTPTSIGGGFLKIISGWLRR